MNEPAVQLFRGVIPSQPVGPGHGGGAEYVPCTTQRLQGALGAAHEFSPSAFGIFLGGPYIIVKGKDKNGEMMDDTWKFGVLCF